LLLKTSTNTRAKLYLFQQHKESHLKAVFWLPSTIWEAFVYKDIKQRKKEQLQLQKKDKKKLEAASRLYNKQVTDEAMAAWQHERKRKKEEKEAKAVRVQWVDHKCKVNSDEFDRVQRRTRWRFLSQVVG
jgi:hypothetical protein